MPAYLIQITASFDDHVDPEALLEGAGAYVMDWGANTVLTKVTEERSLVAMKRRERNADE